MIKASLESIQRFLGNLGMECEIIPGSEEVEIDTLAVVIDEEDIPQPLLLQIRISKEDLSTVDEELEEQQLKEKDYHVVQFILGVPVKTSPDTMGELSRFLLVINSTFPFPGFEISEVAELVYYRYGMIAPAAMLDERALISIIGTMEMAVSTYYETIKNIIEGKQTLVDILKQAAEMIKEEEGEQASSSE